MSFQPVELAQEFVRIPSVTDNSNAEISRLMADRLRQLNFHVSETEYRDRYGTTKFRIEALRRPAKGKNETQESPSRPVAFFCHNDVVSVEGWDCPHGGPFEAAIQENRLWGRGSCDMKGPVAAALSAISSISHDKQLETIYVFITGDEENGMVGALDLQQSELFQELVESQGVGLISEPTDLEIVHSHKGGCHFDVVATGVAAHSSTTRGRNANWQMIPFLSYLQEVQARCLTDQALLNDSFSPPDMSMNLVIENEPSASNITVGTAACRVFLRPMPNTNWRDLIAEISAKATELGLEMTEYPPLPPLHTDPEREFVRTATSLANKEYPLSVCFATDGCFLTQLEDLIVIGPGSIEQAHRSDEFICVEQLRLGTEFYAKILRHYVCK